jgi:hypothetical protein
MVDMTLVARTYDAARRLDLGPYDEVVPAGQSFEQVTAAELSPNLGDGKGQAAAA